MVRAFLIGAGATKAQYDEAPLNADFFKLLQSQTEEGLKLFWKIKNSIQSFLDQPLEKSNIEDVIIKSYQFPSSIRISFMESLYSAIYYSIAEPTESDSSSMNHYIYTPRTPPTLFKTLIDDPRLNEEDFFMTLNYDLYLDRELLSIQNNKIDYGISKEFLNKWRRIDFLSKPKFSVYHLHGSLNWGIYEDKLSIDQGAVIPKYTRYGINLCLIPPGKKELSPVLKSIWSIAEERLLKADELIIIGCSLNLKDTELINLVQKFVNEKGSENIKIIYKEDSLENWKNGRPWPILKNSKYEQYLRVTQKEFKAYPYGFILPGPPDNPRYGAIEFIFDKSK